MYWSSRYRCREVVSPQIEDILIWEWWMRWICRWMRWRLEHSVVVQEAAALDAAQAKESRACV
jgi:hypothetical protein